LVGWPPASVGRIGQPRLPVLAQFRSVEIQASAFVCELRRDKWYGE
jgi:hypothetical protein